MKDYRRFISAHLQFLTVLCDLSIQSVNDSVSQFLSSLFITSQLQSSIIFQAQIDSLVTKSKSNAPLLFARSLSLLRAINHGNVFISTYGTNFQYHFPRWTRTYSSPYGKNVCCCSLLSNKLSFDQSSPISDED